MRTLGPVSYTHLDVYKRQLLKSQRVTIPIEMILLLNVLVKT